MEKIELIACAGLPGRQYYLLLITIIRLGVAGAPHKLKTCLFKLLISRSGILNFKNFHQRYLPRQASFEAHFSQNLPFLPLEGNMDNLCLWTRFQKMPHVSLHLEKKIE